MDSAKLFFIAFFNILLVGCSVSGLDLTSAEKVKFKKRQDYIAQGLPEWQSYINSVNKVGALVVIPNSQIDLESNQQAVIYPADNLLLASIHVDSSNNGTCIWVSKRSLLLEPELHSCASLSANYSLLRANELKLDLLQEKSIKVEHELIATKDTISHSKELINANHQNLQSAKETLIELQREFISLRERQQKTQRFTELNDSQFESVYSLLRELDSRFGTQSKSLEKLLNRLEESLQ